MTFCVLGNWKSNGNSQMVEAFEDYFQELTLPQAFTAGLALPYHLLRGTQFKGALLGAQNVSCTKEGAFTGEISAGMLQESGCSFALVGHSERRALLGETIADTKVKLVRLLEHDLLPVLCVGETLEQRQAGLLEEILSQQLAPLKDVAKANLVIAYEPVWAIGTGVAARVEDVAQAHRFIQNWSKTHCSARHPILYGGSVKPENAAALAAIAEVGGFLVGGASLKVQDFDIILKGALESRA